MRRPAAALPRSGAGCYKPTMQRGRKRLGVALLVAALVLAGGYGALWLVLARNVEQGFVAWVEEARSSGIDVAWQRIGLGGFPLALRVELGDATFTDHALDPPLALRAPRLWAAASPWDFRIWHFGAESGLTAELAGAEERPPLRLAADAARGAFWARPEGGATLWLRLRKAAVAAGDKVRAERADLWLMQPASPPRADTDPLVAAAFDLDGIELPAAARFGDAIDEVAVALTVKGPFAEGPLRRAAAAWRAAGGTVDLDRLHLQWGTLDAIASGTLALDRELQPEGALSGTVEGFDPVIGALVRAGLMPAKNAGIARLALMVLARAGPDGRPRISTSLRIQDGQMFLGPARLGPAPHIAWQ
jgi:hypothetical protein